MVIVEGQPVDALRVTIDGEGASVEFAVVERAQADQVRGFGDTAVPPVLEVVILKEPGQPACVPVAQRPVGSSGLVACGFA